MSLTFLYDVAGLSTMAAVVWAFFRLRREGEDAVWPPACLVLLLGAVRYLLYVLMGLSPSQIFLGTWFRVVDGISLLVIALLVALHLVIGLCFRSRPGRGILT